MPTLDLVGNDLLDRLFVRAVMLWPNDEVRREGFVASEYVRIEGLDRGNDNVEVPRWLVRNLANALPARELQTEGTAHAKSGKLAGYVLQVMFLVWKYPAAFGRIPKTASINQALAAVASLGKAGLTYGGSADAHARLPTSTTTIKNAWREYRNVAHLWAALNWDEDVRPIVRPPRSMFKPGFLGAFLEAAHYFQCFGVDFELDNRSKQDAEHLLGSSTIWAVPQQLKPRLPLPKDVGFLAGSRLAEALRKYRA